MKEERMEVEEEKDEKDEENEEEGNYENEINELKVLNIFYPAQLVGIQHVHLTAQLNFITLKLLREIININSISQPGLKRAPPPHV